MPRTIQLYLEQAALCGKLAEEAELPNQRERFLQAQAKWKELADRAIDTEDKRLKR